MFDPSGHGTDRGMARQSSAVALPELVTREDWYARMHERLGAVPACLTAFEREVMLRAAAREAVASGVKPPFRLRPGLLAEILMFYDALRRHRRTLDMFERLAVGELEPSADVDRGARRMLRQTRFLIATLRAFEARIADSGLLDEHALRERLLTSRSSDPFRHVVLTVPDQAAGAEGLWRADFDLLTRLPDLEQIDVVATEASLAAGFHERLHEVLPGLEEERIDVSCPSPALRTPSTPDGALWFTQRDREEELLSVVRTLKGMMRADASPAAGAVTAATPRLDDGIAVVFQRPLPYLYLARHVFDTCGVPFQAFDALPLAAEPYAASVDLVFDFVASDLARSATVALLRSPHFEFLIDDRVLTRGEVAALDRRLRAVQYRGTAERLETLVSEWTARPAAADLQAAAQAARAALEASRELEALARSGSAFTLLDTLLVFLQRHDTDVPGADPLQLRHRRARAAILGAIRDLRHAHAVYDPEACEASDLRSTLRRWIESSTFSPHTGTGGVYLVDAPAAAYGRFSDVVILGLVEDEWPPRRRRSIFYPAWLLRQLGWPADTDGSRAARAAFRDLLRLPTHRLTLSTFQLEEDTVVGPSTLLEDVADEDLITVQANDSAGMRVSVEEALASDPVVTSVAHGAAADWLAIRLAHTDADTSGFVEATGSSSLQPYSVSRLERYLECPFKYFAAAVLRLDEESAEAFALTPRERGQLLHKVLRRFFERWQRSGRGNVDQQSLDDALDGCRRVVESVLQQLPDSERALERVRLLGSIAAPGPLERLLRLEAEAWAQPIRERLLEHSVAGTLPSAADTDRHPVALKGTIDRIDLLHDGTFRLLDYKLGRKPTGSRAIQLPVYATLAAQHLTGRHGVSWTLGEAAYVTFRGASLLGSMATRGRDVSTSLATGQARCLEAVDGIERGEFPVTPAEPFRCSWCGYATVCRKDDVGEF